MFFLKNLFRDLCPAKSAKQRVKRTKGTTLGQKFKTN